MIRSLIYPDIVPLSARDITQLADRAAARPRTTRPVRVVTGTTAKFPPRPDPRVLSASIPLFFIGRNKHAFWVARAAEGQGGGIFLLKRSALRFAAKNSAPTGCATMFLSERFELDVENQGGVLAGALDAMIRILAAPAPPPLQLMANRKSPHHRRAA